MDKNKAFIYNCKTTSECNIFKISTTQITQFAKMRKNLDQQLAAHKAYLKKNGMPQVDYIMSKPRDEYLSPIERFRFAVERTKQLNQSSKK